MRSILQLNVFVGTEDNVVGSFHWGPVDIVNKGKKFNKSHPVAWVFIDSVSKQGDGGEFLVVFEVL